MSEEVAIKVDRVYKDFTLPHLRKNSVKSVFTSVFDRANDRTSETQHALKDISFEIKKGEFFGIVGRNGSGKSTLLKMLAGIYQPTKGSVQVRGKLVPFIELGVGFNPELTGRENVYLNGALLGFDRRQIDQMYEDIVEFAELEKFMDQKLKNYSSGMQVRLAFSMAIRADADILLIDEVLAVGDADFQRKCFEYFKSLKKKKKTVVFVSHDMSAVESYCDRAILIDKHRIVESGSVGRIVEGYLKLFNTEVTEQEESQQVSERWGNGKAKFDSINIEVTADKVKIIASVTAHSFLENPIFGCQIKNNEGQPLCGSNSKILKKKTDVLKKGETVVVGWEFPDIFSSGKYSVDIAISEPDEITQCDWWNDASIFRISNRKSTPHLVSPKVSMHFDKIK
jgi:ABC-2 type transport system ATP-binding protein